MNDAKAIRAALIKQIRRNLLDALNLVYPVPFGFDSICSSLLHLDVGPDLIQKDLHYLIQKGYIEWVNCPARGWVPWEKRMYVLTATGKEFVDGMVGDPALEP